MEFPDDETLVCVWREMTLIVTVAVFESGLRGIEVGPSLKVPSFALYVNVTSPPVSYS